MRDWVYLAVVLLAIVAALMLRNSLDFQENCAQDRDRPSVQICRTDAYFYGYRIYTVHNSDR